MKYLLSPLAFFAFLAAAVPAFADTAYVGMAKPWQLNFQPPATSVMQRLFDMHQFLLVIIIAISIFVLVLMTYICLRFSAKNNPVPSKTTHNTRLEVIWTVIPIIILVLIAIPSLRIHYFMEVDNNPELTIKVVGYQWYWHYDYPDNGGFGFDSYIKKGADLKAGDIRMLSVDNQMVVPVDTNIRIQLTGADVIHSWSVPAFGVKRDAVPGRLNQTWFKAEKIGTFYGQCSQLCGVGHGFMPIVVNVVSKDDYATWVKKKQAEAGVSTPAPAGEAQKQKAQTPVTPAVSAEHKDAAPVIAKEKATSKPAAANNQPAKNARAKENEPAPAKASGDKPDADIEDVKPSHSDTDSEGQN